MRPYRIRLRGVEAQVFMTEVLRGFLAEIHRGNGGNVHLHLFVQLLLVDLSEQDFPLVGRNKAAFGA